jgi:hypothetical protein
MRYPGFFGGSAPSQSIIATSERTMNWYLERIGSEGVQSKTAFYPTPGFQAFVGASAGITDVGARGALSVDGHTWFVIGQGVYEAFASASVTRLFSVAQNSSPAQIAYNGPTGGEICVASGTNAYNYDINTHALTTVLTGEATQIGMLDEYFLALNSATGKLRLSNLNDGTTWDPTQFALRSAQPDPWIAMGINPPDIWLLGGLTGDIWYDAGSSPFPLEPRQGLTLPFGIAAPFSLAFSGGTAFWLTQNRDGAGMVVMAESYQPKPISSVELATALSTYARTSTIADAEGFTYQQEGHTFYVLRFPAANATWAYDLTTGLWAERGKQNGDHFDVWAPRVHTYAFGKHLVGDATAQISTMDVTYGSEADGAAIRRVRRVAVLVNENKRMPLGTFEVLAEMGLGLQTGQGSDPQMMFRASSDGGKTWGNERQASVGKVGDYLRRFRMTRLGSPRMWVPEVSTSDPTPMRLIDAFLEMGGQS